MRKNKSYYLLDLYEQNTSITGFIITKWKAIQWFIRFLRNPQERKITFTKLKEIKDDDTGEYRVID